MLFFLTDMLMIALLITGRHHEPAVGSGPNTERAHRSADKAVDTPERHPTGAARSPHRSTVSQRSSRGPVRPGGFTGSEFPVWTALDDHQLTRLLRQSSP